MSETKQVENKESIENKNESLVKEEEQKVEEVNNNEKTDNSNENNGKRKKTVSSLDKFGSRILKDESKVFEYNAW